MGESIDHDSIQRWEVLEERLIYEHRPWLRLVEQDVLLPGGYVIEKYLISQTPDVAMVFAVTDHREVIFVEQYKHGMRCMSLDLPAGYIDASDPSPLVAARRELREETGFVTDDWQQLASLFMSPNRSDAQIHYFLARGCRRTSNQHLDPSEDIAVVLFPLEDVKEFVFSGKVKTASTATGIALGYRGYDASNFSRTG